jgi:hypothetical protein
MVSLACWMYRLTLDRSFLPATRRCNCPTKTRTIWGRFILNVWLAAPMAALRNDGYGAAGHVGAVNHIAKRAVERAAGDNQPSSDH